MAPPPQRPTALPNAAAMPDSRLPSWPQGRSLHGGADQVPLPAGLAGRLWLCGKRFVAPDPEGALEQLGATTVVCLCETGELADRYPHYVEWLRANEPRRALWHPIPDLHAPPLAEALDLWRDLRARLAGGEGIVLHCGAGIGRAGTVAAGLLVTLGDSPGEAVAHIGAHRPTAGPEVGAQSALLEALGAHLGAAGNARSGAPAPLDEESAASAASAASASLDTVQLPGHHREP